MNNQIKTMHETNLYNLTPNEQEALTLVKSDLFQILIQSTYSRVNLYRFLNRLLVIFQQPTKLSIFYHENGKAEPSHKLNTYMGECADGYLLKDFIQKKIDEGNINKHLVRIYNTHYSILPVRAFRDPEEDDPEGDKTRYIPLKFNLYPEETEENRADLGCIRILKAVLSNDAMGLDPLFEYLGAKEYWDEILESAFTNVKYPVPCEKLLNADELEPTIKSFSDDILEDSYRDFMKSKLLRKSGSIRPLNVAYFVRSYDHYEHDRIYRFNDIEGERGQYNYNVRMMIPRTQKEDFRRTFKEIKKAIKNTDLNDKWQFENRKLCHFYHARYAELFMEELKKENGIETILDCLQEPYGKYTRSFVDPAFITSFLDIRRAPLDRMHSLDRLAQFIDADEKQYNDEQIRKEMLRITSLFYLFSTMAPEVLDNEESKVSCMIRPLRVGVSPWLSFVCFTEFPDTEKECYLSWQMYRHWYYDVGTVQGRRIRDRMKHSYLKQIKTHVSEGFNQVFGDADVLDVKALANNLNGRFFNLCRAYPFRCVQVHISQHHTPPGFYDIQLTEGKFPYWIGVTIIDNPFYPSHIEKDFTENDELVYDEIQKGIDLYIQHQAVSLGSFQ